MCRVTQPFPARPGWLLTLCSSYSGVELGSRPLRARDSLWGLFLHPLLLDPKASGRGSPFLRPALSCAHAYESACVHVCVCGSGFLSSQCRGDFTQQGKKVNLFMEGGGTMSKCTCQVRTVICGLCVKCWLTLGLCRGRNLAIPECHLSLVSGYSVPGKTCGHLPTLCPQFTDGKSEAQKGQMVELD